VGERWRRERVEEDARQVSRKVSRHVPVIHLLALHSLRGKHSVLLNPPKNVKTEFMDNLCI
jgi:hypothetical protein